MAAAATYAAPQAVKQANETADTEFAPIPLANALRQRVTDLMGKHKGFNDAMMATVERSEALVSIAWYLSRNSFSTHEYVAVVEDMTKGAGDHV